MASHVSNDIPSLTRFVFVDEEGVYRISINTIKEMKKKDWNLDFLKEKLSLFIQRLGFNIFTLLVRVCSTLIWSLLPRLTVVCVCWQMSSEHVYSRVQRSCGSWPSCSLRSWIGCKVYVCTLIQNTSHMDLSGMLGRVKVASRSQDHWLILFQNLQGEAEVLYPKIHVKVQIV